MSIIEKFHVRRRAFLQALGITTASLALPSVRVRADSPDAEAIAGRPLDPLEEFLEYELVSSNPSLGIGFTPLTSMHAIKLELVLGIRHIIKLKLATRSRIAAMSTHVAPGEALIESIRTPISSRDGQHYVPETLLRPIDMSILVSECGPIPMDLPFGIVEIQARSQHEELLDLVAVFFVESFPEDGGCMPFGPVGDLGKVF